MSIHRIWQAARAKVDAEGMCRVCADREGIEAAHVIGREHDKWTLEQIERRSKTWHVEPVRIVPLCEFHHRIYDAHNFDLLPYLTADEQAQAVRDAGSIELARTRIGGI